MQSIGMVPTTLPTAAERVALLQAIGALPDSMSLCSKMLRENPDYRWHGAMASLFGEIGDTSTAERHFDESRARYRGVSPIPPALLEFRRGHMWLENDDPVRAAAWFSCALELLPDYAVGEGHLAEALARTGDYDGAIKRLRRVAAKSEDPGWGGILSRLLLRQGTSEESRLYGEAAEARFDDLLERYPEAYADHAANFFLDYGIRLNDALRYAHLNARILPNRRAKLLLERAIAAREAAE